MTVKCWKLLSMPVVMLGLASPMLMNCSGAGRSERSLEDLANIRKGCDALSSDDFLKMPITRRARLKGTIKGLLDGSYSLQKAVGGYRVDLYDACSGLAKALGAPEAELKDDDPNMAVDKACRVAAD